MIKQGNKTEVSNTETETEEANITVIIIPGLSLRWAMTVARSLSEQSNPHKTSPFPFNPSDRER